LLYASSSTSTESPKFTFTISFSPTSHSYLHYTHVGYSHHFSSDVKAVAGYPFSLFTFKDEMTPFHWGHQSCTPKILIGLVRPVCAATTLA
jgi:hypothetical protein